MTNEYEQPEPPPTGSSLVERLERAVENTVSQAASSNETHRAAWIFQANPDRFNLRGALESLSELTWLTRQHADKIHGGNRAFLWESGKNAGVVAVAEVLTEPELIPEDAEEKLFSYDSTLSNEIELRVRLQIKKVLPRPIKRENLLTHPILKDMLIMKQAAGTNFTLSSAEAQALEDLVNEVGGAEKEKGLTMADAAWTILSESGGGPLHLNNIYNQATARGLVKTRGKTPQLALYSVMLRDPRFTNLGENEWILADSETDKDADQVDYTSSATQFWRIHFPREYWKEARLHGVIGINWEEQEKLTNQSAKRFRRIKTGDRIIAYIQGGTIGSIGIVTHPYDDENPSAGSDAPLFGGSYLRRIGVKWADQPAEPVDLSAVLKSDANAALYNRLKNTHTILQFSEEDYTHLLSLLEVGDAGNVSTAHTDTRLPRAWPALAMYQEFIQLLDGPLATADQLYSLAQEYNEGFNKAEVDEETLVDELRQFRLLASTADGHYARSGYAAEGGSALLRLMALGLLLPVEGATTTYYLPSRKIVARLRPVQPSLSGTEDDYQPVTGFAPELSVDGPLLLGWYAEAGFVTVEEDRWRPTADALQELPGEDEATQMYNRFLTTLLADEVGALPTDLPPIESAAVLPRTLNLEERLRELAKDLLIDARIVKRIYRSLIAGRHVVLSGPPGTGKTELARRLPELLWREEEQVFARLGTDLDSLPVVEQKAQRHGYKASLVTATEDWGVRDVVGGISPNLDGAGGSLRYDIKPGHLTRALVQNYAGMDGRPYRAQDSATLRRGDYFEGEGPNRKRYRGVWLIIDEFTRAPVDAAFGSLLTALGGSDPRLSIPTVAGEALLPIPRDFRIIGTLNSFDRHFLNQISEALKRRFDFIDVLPPPPAQADFEQGIALARALRKLHENGFAREITRDPDEVTCTWAGVLRVVPGEDAGVTRPVLDSASTADPAVADVLRSFWQIFSTIRVFRQLGTAQAEAVYTNLFAGVLAGGMPWDEALDTALADSLADQLQVLTREEQRILEAYLQHSEGGFLTEVKKILEATSRYSTLLHAFREADLLLHPERGSAIDTTGETPLSDEQLEGIFALGKRLALPPRSVFRRRLHDLINERGL